MKSIILAPVAALSLSACASVTSTGDTFEGAADFKFVPQVASTDGKAPLLEPVDLAEHTRFQKHPTEVSTGDANFFTQGDFISVSMRTGVVGWFSEGLEQRALNGLFDSPLKGEIAILANVTEGMRSPGSLDADGNLEGRVVFYSGDIYRGQRLNEFNLPIYGPTRYEGGPLTIDFWVLELDRSESQQMEAVLTTLSSLSTELPVMASPGIDILSRIGTAFLQSNQDDVIGHMTLTLMQPRPGQSTQDPILQVGDLIASRREARGEGIGTLDGCTYDPASGRVYETANTANSCGLTDGENVLVFAIRKVPEGQSIAPTVTLAELTNRVSNAQVGSSAIPNLSSAIEVAADQALSKSAYSDSMLALERIMKGSTGGPRQVDADFILKNIQCSLLSLRETPVAELEEACGARASVRHLGINDLNRLTTMVVKQTCVADEDLSLESLLPAAFDETSLREARLVVVPKLKRPPVVNGTANIASCNA